MVSINVLSHYVATKMCQNFKPYETYKRINRCQAYTAIGQTTFGDTSFYCIALKSYETIVGIAVYNAPVKQWVFVIQDYYSQTTVNHWWKFIRSFNPDVVLYSYNRKSDIDGFRFFNNVYHPTTFVEYMLEISESILVK